MFQCFDEWWAFFLVYKSHDRYVLIVWTSLYTQDDDSIAASSEDEDSSHSSEESEEGDEIKRRRSHIDHEDDENDSHSDDDETTDEEEELSEGEMRLLNMIKINKIDVKLNFPKVASLFLYWIGPSLWLLKAYSDTACHFCREAEDSEHLAQCPVYSTVMRGADLKIRLLADPIFTQPC